jgi:protein-disulfide isomerase
LGRDGWPDPGAPKAAEGALCAGDQDQYWGMHDLIFQNLR